MPQPRRHFRHARVHFLFGRLRRICGARKNGSRADRGGKGARFGQNQKRKIHRLLQSYTNTYADVGYLRKIFTQAAEHPDIAALSVATRPDCLEEEKTELFGRAVKSKTRDGGAGAQTVHEQTARYIRRGYPLPVFDDAVKRLRRAGLETVAHVILFLPGESEQMMLKTVRHAADCGIDGIKLQLLHVLSGTDLEKDYAAGKFSLPSMEQYIQTLKKCIRILPPNVVIHRLTGDGAKRELVAPLWSADKKRVLNAINAEFKRDNVIQGSDYIQNSHDFLYKYTKSVFLRKNATFTCLLNIYR